MRDAILIISLILIAIFLVLIIESQRSDGSFAVVTVDGEAFGEYDLSHDAEYILNGGTNILTVKDGKAYISYANCSNQLCVNQGKIFESGERIVCLPNKIMVEIKK